MITAAVLRATARAIPPISSTVGAIARGADRTVLALALAQGWLIARARDAEQRSPWAPMLDEQQRAQR